MKFDLVVKREPIRRRLDVNGKRTWTIFGHDNAGAISGSDYHYARIEIGSPPQVADFIIDSGSSLPYMACEDTCKVGSCGTHTHKKYDKTLSETYFEVDCDHEKCKKFSCHHGHTSHSKGECTFSISYMEGSSVHGTYIGEYIIMNEKKVPILIGCIETETKLIYSQDADGIIGISTKEISLIRQLLDYDEGLQHVMALCFAHDGGYLGLGQKYIPENIQWTEWPRGGCKEDWYKFSVDRILVAGEETEPRGYSAYRSDAYCGTVLDTGCSDILIADKQLFLSIVEKFKQKMVYSTVRVKPNSNVCFTHSDMDAMLNSIPAITFELANNARLVAPKDNILYQVTHKTICLSLYNQGSGIMIGGSAMKNNLIIADLANRRIGILPEVDCTQQIINPLYDSEVSNVFDEPNKVVDEPKKVPGEPKEVDEPRDSVITNKPKNSEKVVLDKPKDSDKTIAENPFSVHDMITNHDDPHDMITNQDDVHDMITNHDESHDMITNFGFDNLKQIEYNVMQPTTWAMIMTVLTGLVCVFIFCIICKKRRRNRHRYVPVDRFPIESIDSPNATSSDIEFDDNSSHRFLSDLNK